MASEKILNEKKQIVSEIVDKIKNSESVIIFAYQGLTVSELTELRNQLKEVNSEVRVYKNTMLNFIGFILWIYIYILCHCINF